MLKFSKDQNATSTGTLLVANTYGGHPGGSAKPPLFQKKKECDSPGQESNLLGRYHESEDQPLFDEGRRAEVFKGSKRNVDWLASRGQHRFLMKGGVLKFSKDQNATSTGTLLVANTYGGHPGGSAKPPLFQKMKECDSPGQESNLLGR